MGAPRGASRRRAHAPARSRPTPCLLPGSARSSIPSGAGTDSEDPLGTRTIVLGLALATGPAPASAESWDYHEGPTGIRRALASSRAELPDGSSAALLRVQCRPDADGALCVSLKVEGAEANRSFDFAAFEGPDAPARGQRLLSAHWNTGAEPASLEAALSGSFVPEPKGAFLFELCAANPGASEAATLAQALASARGEIEIRGRRAVGG